MKKRIIMTILMTLSVLVLASCLRIELSDVMSITVNWQPQSEYLIDEEENLSNVTLTAVFEDETEEVYSLSSTEVTLDNVLDQSGNVMLDTSEHGDHVINISYGGVTVAFNYSVYDAIVTTSGYTMDAGEEETSSDTPINSAIGAVSEDGWIFVETGEYNEYVTEVRATGDRHHGIFINNKSVHLRASDYVYLEPQDASGDPMPVFSIIRINNNAPVTIEGFVLADSWQDFGVYQYSTNSPAPLYFRDNHINAAETIGNGISLQFDGSGSIISGNTIYVSPTPDGWDGVAMVLATSSWTVGDITDVTISDNTIIRSLDPSTGGIAIQQTNSKKISNINITNNTLSGGTQGAVQIQTDGSGLVSDITISNNTFTQSFYAIYLNGTNSEMLTNFIVTDNRFINDTGEEHFIIGAPTSLMDSINFGSIMENNDWNGNTPEIVTSTPTGAWTYLFVSEED